MADPPKTTAPPKAPKPTPPPVVQGALADAETAAGREFIREGFGFTAEDDLVYALGWPYMVWLEHGDASAKELADPSLFSRKHPFESGPVPITVATRKLRHLHSLRDSGEDTKKWLAAINNNTPIDANEREALLDFVTTEALGFNATFLLEALFTTRVVLDGLVARILEKKTAKAWSSGMFETFGGGCVRALHFLLLRTDAAHAKATREKLSALYKEILPELESANSGSRPIKILDTSINGREGTERSAPRFSGVLQSDAMFAIDDLDYVREKALAFIPTMTAADRSHVSARIGFLGGDAVMQAIVESVKNIHSAHRDHVAIGFSRSKHPLVPEIMKGLGSAAAKRYLKAHVPA